MPNGKQPIWTYTYCIVCIAVFLLDRLSAYMLYGLMGADWNGLLTQWGMRLNSAIAAGQYWRLITPMFLHGSLIHLGMNLLALLIWGPMAEFFFSGKKYVTLLVGASFLACAMGFAFSSHPSVGASGAIFGLLGAFLSIRKQNKAFFDRFFGPTILVYVAISLGMGFLTGSIDNWGHIGGLAGGYLLGISLGFGPFSGNKAMRIGAVCIYGLLCAALIFWGFYRI